MGRACAQAFPAGLLAAVWLRYSLVLPPYRRPHAAGRVSSAGADTCDKNKPNVSSKMTHRLSRGVKREFKGHRAGRLDTLENIDRSNHSFTNSSTSSVPSWLVSPDCSHRLAAKLNAEGDIVTCSFPWRCTISAYRSCPVSSHRLVLSEA